MYISKHEDKAFKILIDITMADFLKSIGVEEEIMIPLPTEIMTTNCINRRLDYCGLSRKYEIINVEFQSSKLTKEDEIRIFDYASSLFVKHKLPVKTFVISTVEDESRVIKKWHHNDLFTIHVISLKDKDALEHLNKIKSKIKNKETSNDEDSSNNEEILSNRLTSNTSNNKDGLKNAESLKNGESSKEAKILNNEDAVTLVSIIFMKSDLTESELLFEVAKLVNKAEFELDFIKNQVKAILLILGNKFIEKENEDEFKRFKEIVTVGSSYFASVFERVGEGIRQEVMEEAKAEAKEEYMNGVDKGRLIGLDQGIGIGELKGREEGDESRAISVANWMLNKGMSIKDISEATELSVEKINSLKEEMQDNDGE